MSVTGKKAFTGTVKLHLDDTALGTFNDVDLGAAYSSHAFIDEDTSFPAADSFTATAITACSPGWTYLEHTGKCYYFSTSKSKWSDALKTCESYNPTSTLASVHDETTNDFLVTLTGGPNEWTWLGGSQFGPKDWRWTDGSDWTGYTNWGPGQPDNTGGHLHLYNQNAVGQWNDNFAKEKLKFICQSDPSISSPCATGWTYLEHTGNCYYFSTSKSSWSDARKTCESYNPTSTLASVPDQTTNDFLATLSNDGHITRTWLGGYQEDSEVWQWTDGSQWKYVNWGRRQPDNNQGIEHYLHTNFEKRGMWNDHKETMRYKFICQYPSSTSSVMTVQSLRAKESISIPASIVKTDAGSDINLEKLYQNTILKSSDDTVSIKGSLVFSQDVTLNADSTIESLDDSDSSLSIPDDLLLTTATEFSGSPGKH